MKSDTRSIWLNSIDLILKRPIVFLPFGIIALLEYLALEVLYFSTRQPLSFVLVPILRKYFSETSVHYPGNLYILPRVFSYAESFLYIAAGVFLTALAVHLIKSITLKTPVKLKISVRNVLKSYIAFIIYGILVIVLILLLRKADMLILAKSLKFLSGNFPNRARQITPFVVPVFLFCTNVFMQIFLTATVPVMVIQKAPLWKALPRSILLGFRRFPTMFALVFLPLMLYFPVALMKVFALKISQLTSPEIIFGILISGIIAGAVINCFVFANVSQLLLEKKE